MSVKKNESRPQKGALFRRLTTQLKNTNLRPFFFLSISLTPSLFLSLYLSLSFTLTQFRSPPPPLFLASLVSARYSIVFESASEVVFCQGFVSSLNLYTPSLEAAAAFFFLSLIFSFRLRDSLTVDGLSTKLSSASGDVLMVWTISSCSS